MVVNLKINMCCNNNIINVINANSIYGKINFVINNNDEYMCRLICYYVGNIDYVILVENK